MSSDCDRDVLVGSLFDDAGMFCDEDEHIYSGTESLTCRSNGENVDHSSPQCGISSTMAVDTSNALVSLATTDVNEEDAICGDEDNWIPTPGYVVEHIIDGFVRYSNYARRSGFQIRFRSSETSSKLRGVADGERRKRMRRGLGRDWFYADYGSCSRVRLQCVKGEVPRPNRRDPSRPVRSQASKCMAGVSLVNIGEGSWVFKTVRLEHNHECDTTLTRFMKNYRIVSAGDELQIVVSDRAGVTPSRIFTTFAVGYGGVENVPFSADDCRAVVRNSRSLGMENGDFNGMQKLFNDLIANTEDFFYLYDIDEEGRVQNVFWADGRSRGAYKHFGDVVCFDTTHLKNRYKMPLAPFIGVNHHGQSILLGLALVSNETTEAFCWVFEAWMKCMRNQHPKCIMTDQCQAIGNAVAVVFPNTSHRWCLWHVMRNGEQKLKRKSNWAEIRHALKETVHDSCNVEGFEGMWNQFVMKFDLHDNEWIRRMYAARERWVPVFFGHEFWAGLHSTQRSEGMNNFFRSYVNINTTLRQFAQQYCLFVGKRVDDEERENWRSVNRPVLCATIFPCEILLQQMYTSTKFLEIQKEAKGVGYTNIELLTGSDGLDTYMVTDRGVEKAYGGVVTRRFSVIYNKETHETICECRRFDFRGIICRHMIGVWQVVELRFVPQRYILDRWRKDKFREYSVVKIPNYSLAIDKSVECRKVEELHNVMRYISSLALGCAELYSSLMPGLDILRKKCDEFIGCSDDIMVDSVGRFYKKHPDDGDDVSVPDLTVKFVLDPPDKRGRGRVPLRRKGYRKEKRKRTAIVGESATQVFFA